MDRKKLLQELLQRYPDPRKTLYPEDRGGIATPAGAGMLNGLGTQQPEPVTGTGLQTAGGKPTEDAAGAQVIGPEEIAKAGETLQKYKAGKASLDKLGAAGSYLMQAEGLSLLGGDALPLGILENVESGEKLMQLHQGDTLILLSDGVEDAYENRQSMEEAIRDALTLETAQDAANAILTGAQSGDTAPADDQTVLVLRLIRARADAKIEEMYQ